MKTKVISLLSLAAVAIMLAACANMKAERIAYVQDNPQLSPAAATAIIAGKSWPSMSVEDMWFVATHGWEGPSDHKADRVQYVRSHPELAPQVKREILEGRAVPGSPDLTIWVTLHALEKYDDGCYMTFDSIYGSVEHCEDGTTNVYNSHFQKIGTAYPHP